MKTKQIKLGLFLAVLLALALAGGGCGLRVGEKTAFQNTEGFAVGCLNGISEKALLYIKGKLTTEEINQVSNCAKTALVLFKSRVRGSIKGEFTPDELRKFIQDLFLQDQIITDNLLAELIKLKQVIIGGPDNKLTVSDIERFITFVDVLQKEAVFFQPYIQALNIPAGEQTSQDRIRLNTIGQDLEKSINRVSIFLNHFSNPYPLKDLKALVRELDFFLDYKNNITRLDAKIDLVGALNKFMTNGSDSVIYPREWEQLLLGYSYLVSAGVNRVFLKKERFFSPEGSQYVFVILRSVMDFLALAVDNHPTKTLKEADFTVLFDYLQPAGLLGERPGKKAFKSALLILFGKMFNVQKDKYGAVELTPEQIKKIKSTLIPWVGLQTFLNSIAKEQPFEIYLSDLTRLREFFPSKEVFIQAKNILTQIWELKPLYRGTRKIHLAGDIYRPAEGKNAMDYENASIYNLYHLIALMLRGGYEQGYPKTPGLTQAEIKNFFLDFNIIGEEMGWFQKTEGRALEEGEAEFMAANMLTPTAKGFNFDWTKEERLSPNELTEYLAYAFSFGFSVQEVDVVLAKLCGVKEEDADRPSALSWEKSQYEVDCVRKSLISVLQKNMGNMPDLQTVLERMSDEGKSSLTEALIHIAFETEQEYMTAQYLNKGNLKNIIMALYFVETTINRYDLDGDLVLQHDEIWQGYPSFKGYLSRVLVYLLCRDSDNLSASIYAYVIEKKSLPSDSRLSALERAYAWLQLNMHDLQHEEIDDTKALNVDSEYWRLFLDREQLTRVFSSIIKGFLAKKRERGSSACPERPRGGPLHLRALDNSSP